VLARGRQYVDLDDVRQRNQPPQRGTGGVVVERQPVPLGPHRTQQPDEGVVDGFILQDLQHDAVGR